MAFFFEVVLGGLLAHFDARADLTLSTTIGQGFDMGRPDRKSTRLNSSHVKRSRMPSSA